jgi:hypothetical protein
MSETSRDKFIRLANKRVNNALKSITLIGNLSNTSNYSYTEKDIEKIFDVIGEEVRKAKSLFRNKTKDTTNKFKL